MSSNKIAIIDYGMGNLHSVASALSHVAPDAEVKITSDIAEVVQADRIVFPGVGAIRDCITEIKRLGFDGAVADAVRTGKPVLAICVGMQSLMQSSEENNGVDCLGMLQGSVKFFSSDPDFNASSEGGSARLKVPHMGWNQVEQCQSHPLWHDIPQSSRFYFVHSYYVALDTEDFIAGETHYGVPFTSAIAKDNLFAVQFHPEKSHKHGLQLLKNFVHWNGSSDQTST